MNCAPVRNMARTERDFAPDSKHKNTAAPEAGPAGLANARYRLRSPNDPSSATRPARRHDCNESDMAGFATAHG